MLLIIALILVPLLDRRVPANGTNINHAIAELDEGAPLHGDIQIGDIMQDEVHQGLVFGLAEPLDERGRGERRARLEGREPVLGEAEVEERGDGHVGGPELLLLLG